MRDKTLSAAKATLRQWFAAQDVAYLARVVDECRAGTFAMWDACHCLKGIMDCGYTQLGIDNFADAAEWALMLIGYSEELRRARSLPIVLAEIRRRQRQSIETADTEREILAGTEFVS